tara:strand:- start:136 stop:534 length:399 start_codon:yes stop_codon:yes gene_type:complete
MKKILVGIVIVFYCQISFAQIYKLKVMEIFKEDISQGADKIPAGTQTFEVDTALKKIVWKHKNWQHRVFRIHEYGRVESNNNPYFWVEGKSSRGVSLEPIYIEIDVFFKYIVSLSLSEVKNPKGNRMMLYFE